LAHPERSSFDLPKRNAKLFALSVFGQLLARGWSELRNIIILRVGRGTATMCSRTKGFELLTRITRGENGSMTLFQGESKEPILNLALNGNSVEVNFPNND
jgi:hypothetical protein